MNVVKKMVKWFITFIKLKAIQSGCYKEIVFENIKKTFPTFENQIFFYPNAKSKYEYNACASSGIMTHG